MKIYLSLIVLFIATHSSAQKDWITKTKTTYSVKHPNSWVVRPSEDEDELTLSGATPDFESSPNYVGTTLFIQSSEATFSNMDEAVSAYKKKLFGMDFLQNVQIKKEKKITFNGVEAVEIIFFADAAKLATGCRIIIFQHNNLYYEVSVTYDRNLSKKLKKEAFKVIDSFDFVD
jgi:hypothetical protein